MKEEYGSLSSIKTFIFKNNGTQQVKTLRAYDERMAWEELLRTMGHMNGWYILKIE